MADVAGTSCIHNGTAAITEWLVEQPRSLWVSTVTEGGECIAEVFCPPSEISAFLLDDISHLPGLREYEATPIFRYYRTVAGWNPGILTAEQLVELGPAEPSELEPYSILEELDSVDISILSILPEDGRSGLDVIASRSGVSKVTAARRVDWLISSGLTTIRAVVDPAWLGYPVEAIVSIEARAQHLEAIALQLASPPIMRWAASATGQQRIIAQVATKDRAELHSLLVSLSSSTPAPESVKASLVMNILKRSDVSYSTKSLA